MFCAYLKKMILLQFFNFTSQFFMEINQSVKTSLKMKNNNFDLNMFDQDPLLEKEHQFFPHNLSNFLHFEYFVHTATLKYIVDGP